MQAPIGRKNHNHPKDFILNRSHLHKVKPLSKQYTFNQQPSLTCSIKQHSEINMVNPQQGEQDSILKAKQQKKISSENLQFHISSSRKKKQLQDLQNEEQVQSLEEMNDKKDFNRYKGEFQDFSKSRILKNYTMRQKREFSEAGLQRSGKIFRNNCSQMKKYMLPQFKNSPQNSQKPFNQLTLSLMGIKRSRVNKSQLDHKTSYNFKKDYELRKGEVEIYENSVLPFRADDINSLKRSVNLIVNHRNFQKSRYIEEKQRKQDFQAQKQAISNQSSPRSPQKMMYSEIRMKNKEKHIKIYHKTSLSNLKGLLSSQINLNKIIIQPPQFFLQPPMEFKKIPDFNQETLHTEAVYIFTSLGIPVENMHVRKYSNCVVIVNGNLCIFWHDGAHGKKYFGSWKNKYFDEGAKGGMGLEWAPGRYIYYGQFQDNKRNGFGIMRKSDQNVVIGFWKDGRHVEYRIQKNFS